MSFGLDFTSMPSIAAMRGANPPVDFACRYVGYFSGYNLNDIAAQQGKCLTPGEAKTLSQAGIAVVSNYEWYGNRAAEGYNSGVWDAQTAQKIHAACGGPGSRPIYFSVDFDTGATAAIIDYFHGVASVIGLARVGAYGGYACIKGLLDAGAIKWAWQTYAWSGGQWDTRAHIQQYSNGVTFDGREVDYDRSMQADFGQWFYGGSMIPTGWKDANGVLIAPNNVPVHDGFRAAIENDPSFDPANIPNEAEYNANPVQYHVADSEDGDRQAFRDTVYWWTPKYGVVVERYPGLELDACYKHIATLQAEIATLKAQQPAPVDTTALVSAINAIPDAIAPAVAQALVEAKKL